MKHGVRGVKHWKKRFCSVLLVKIKCMSIRLCALLKSPAWHLFLLECSSFFETLLLIIRCYSGEHENCGWKQISNTQRGIGAYIPVCSAMRKASTIMARSVFQWTEWANLQKEDKEKWVQFLPSEKVCLLERRIHSRFPGTFDLGLHRKLEDESSTFGLGELMIEQPEVVVASEVKTAADSAAV